MKKRNVRKSVLEKSLLPPALWLMAMGVTLIGEGATTASDMFWLLIVAPLVIWAVCLAVILRAGKQRVDIALPEGENVPRCFLCEAVGALYGVTKVTATVREYWDRERRHTVNVEYQNTYRCSNGHDLSYDDTWGGYVAGENDWLKTARNQGARL